MRKMTESDIMLLADYLKVREAERPGVMAHKGVRRVVLGDKVMVTFETRETMVYQVHEMMRAESLTDRDAVRREMEMYNDLVPAKNQFAATVFVTVTDDAEMREWMPKLIAIDEHILLDFAGHRVRARSEPGRNTEEKTASVHYVWFDLTPEQAEAFVKADGASIVCDHENYQVESPMKRDTFVALRDDLTRE